MRARWQVGVAVAALVSAGALLWLRGVRQQAWLDEMLERECSPLVPVTDIVLLAWGAAALALASGVLLLHVGILGVRTSSRSGGVALAAGIAVLLVALVLVLVVWASPMDPLDGLDGSGLPCGGG